MVAQEFDLLLGRNMQHVNSFPGFMGELDQTLRRHQRRGLVAPHRMRTRIALDAQALAVIETIFVLGMKRGAAADHLEYPPQAFVVLHQ